MCWEVWDALGSSGRGSGQRLSAVQREADEDARRPWTCALEQSDRKMLELLVSLEIKLELW